MALILYAGITPTLAYTRKLLLESAGHSVVIALDDSQIGAACREHKFDIAIISHTVSVPMKQGWLTVIRKNCPSAKILELYRQSTDPVLTDADASLEIGQPAQFIASVASLVS